MLGLTTMEVARALAATLRGRGDSRLGRVVTDSRRVSPGDLFVALPGARTDGHAFLREAQQAGAAAALVQPDRGVRPPDLPVIIVPDCLAALADLARFHLGRLNAQVIGITGSFGKTTAKDFLAHLLGGPDEGVHAAPASYNSEIGLPLAILAAPMGTARLVLEYGINAPGEMSQLISIARPHHAMITALGEAHLEGMGSFETIVAEKSLLGRAVTEQGQVWMTPTTGEQAAEHAQTWCARVTTADTDDGRHRIVDRRPGAWCLEFPRVGEVVLPIVAPHEARLAVLTARAALDLGVDPQDLRPRLESLARPVGRLTVHELGSVTVLDDSYNACPASMRAGISVLLNWPGASRRIAVLGTMHELGCSAEALHRELGGDLANQGFDLAIPLGRGGAWIAEGLLQAGFAGEVLLRDDATAAAATLGRLLRPGDVVLLKASRAEALDRLVVPLGTAARRLGSQHGRGRRSTLRSSPPRGWEGRA